MRILTRGDLLSLEQYASERATIRSQVMAHKKLRTVPIGEHVLLLFEDQLTIRYQIQEMLRIERIFEPEGIDEELAAYNPLIPNGTNWKATQMVQYEDVEERRRALAELVGIEDATWVRIGAHERVFATSDEDLERSNEEKTSAVHFLRFEFDAAMIAAAKDGAPIAIGIDHPHYHHECSPLPPEVATALVADFD